MTFLLAFLCVLSNPDSPSPGDLPPAEFGTFLEGGLGGGTLDSNYGHGTISNFFVEASLQFKYYREYSLGIGASLMVGSGRDLSQDDPDTPDVNENIGDHMTTLAIYMENRFFMYVSPYMQMFASARFGLNHYNATIYENEYDYTELSGNHLFISPGAGIRIYIHKLVYLGIQLGYNFYILDLGSSDEGIMDPKGSLDIGLGLGVAL